jgi:hypothetical protein
VTGRALFAIRRDDGDVADLLRGSHEALQPVGEDAVVVGAEDSHSAFAFAVVLRIGNGLAPVEDRQQVRHLLFHTGQRFRA